MREAVERLLGDRDLAASLGAGARGVVERELTTRHMARRLAPIITGAAR